MLHVSTIQLPTTHEHAQTGRSIIMMRVVKECITSTDIAIDGYDDL